jgi:hypothetical protein
LHDVPGRRQRIRVSLSDDGQRRPHTTTQQIAYNLKALYGGLASQEKLNLLSIFSRPQPKPDEPILGAETSPELVTADPGAPTHFRAMRGSTRAMSS